MTSMNESLRELAALAAEESDGEESTSGEGEESSLSESGGPFRVALDCVDVINYASVSSGIPIVRRLQLQSRNSESLYNLTLALTVECPTIQRVVATRELPIDSVDDGEIVVFDELALKLDVGVLAQLDEAVPGAIVVRLMHDGIELFRQDRPTRLLAHNEFFHSVGMAELVAAHIQPNHPAVVPVLQAAGAILQHATGSSSLEGYQSGAERAVLIAGAIYQALRDLKVGYINPPASFEGSGQKIRTPAQVIEERLGTCLDLACTYAACLEQAGLNPVICLIKGHAYAGLLTDGDIGFKNPSLTLRNVAINLQDGGILVPVETVGFTSGTDIDFAEAVGISKGKWSNDGAFQAVIDVRAARNAGVLPLPARVLRDGQVTVIVQETIVRESRASASTATPKPIVSRPDDPAPARIRQWQASLLDLSLRNPLIHLSTRRTGLPVLVPSGGIGMLEDLLMEGEALSIYAHDGLTELQKEQGARSVADVDAEVRRHLMMKERMIHVEVSEDGLTRRVRALREKARLAEEEGGSNILHLALGSLHWTDPAKGVAVRSPILLMPVRLRSAGRGKPIELVADEVGGTSNNFALLHKLRLSFGLSVPELEKLDGDASGVDVIRALDGLRKAIAVQRLDMRVDEDAAIALFEFGKFRMWKDLDEHWRTFMGNPVVRHLVEQPTEPFKSPVAFPDVRALDAEEVFCPIPCDGTQLEAIVAAAAGASFVLEGPPGTGKSQTITNLIANALAAGKRVLFVAEKRAALTVVKNRLTALGLGPFCLDIHGKGTDAKSLRAQLSESLDRQTGGDVTAWEEGRVRLTERVQRLRAYADALHVAGPHGMSAWSARQRLLQLGEGPEVLPPASGVSTNALIATRELLRELPLLVTDAGDVVTHPWRLVADATVGARLDVARTREALEALSSALATVEGEGAALANALRGGTSKLRLLHAVLVTCEQLPNADVRAAVAAASTGDAREPERIVDSLRRLHEQAAPVRRRFKDSIFGANPSALRQELITAQESFFLFRRGRVRTAMEGITPHLRADVPAESAAISVALKEAAACISLAKSVTDSLRSLLGPLLPGAWTPWTSTALSDAERAAAAYRALGALAREDGGVTIEGFLSAVPRGRNSSRAIGDFLDRLSGLCELVGATEQSLAEFVGSEPYPVAVKRALDGWQSDAKAGFLRLRRWCAVHAAFERLTESGFDDLRRAIQAGRLTASEAADAMERGLARAAIDERFSSTALATFDGLTHRRLVQGFVEMQSLDSKLLREIIPARLVAKRRFKPGETMGEVGELRRNELARQRGGLSIRALLKRYVRAITELTPCLLMSPDSVAQFLEPGMMAFDLVVFDEASQVPVPDAIGAIARGRSLVVVGDSRQMPPTAFFSSGAVNDKEAPDEIVTTGAPVDLESILSECVESGLQRIWLSWHYRSQQESLIAFSNARYYEGRLASFPAPTRGERNAGVLWRKIEDGIFDRGNSRTNEREAQAVVKEVGRRLRDGPKQSIGVVTFNLEQADLITSLLEEAAVSDAAIDAALRDDDLEHRLFVKNLENVQGDERDVILMTIGFARDASGAFPMNFGPLNRMGGERRWNVAVTRAKREFVVFSSVEPEDIDLSRVGAGATGVRHLRAYMEMARDGVTRLGDVAALGRHGPDGHRDDIVHGLRSAGLLVEADLGLSSFKVDLALSHKDAPNRQLVAVLLDGPGYAARRTVQDRDALPVTVLEQLMRWPATMRIWLPEWLHDRERVVREASALVERLHGEAIAAVSTGSVSETISIAQTDPIGTVTQTQPSGVHSSSPVHVASQKTPSFSAGEPVPVTTTRAISAPGFTPYEVDEGDLGDTAALEAAVSASGRVRIVRAIDQILAVEGPTEVGRLGRLIGRRFGLSRVRTERVNAILACLPDGRIRRSPLGDFVWPLGVSPEEWREYRHTPAGCNRPLECIPPEEVRNAILDFVARGLSIAEDELLESLAELLDIKRMTTSVRERLLQHVAATHTSGAVRKEGDRYLLAGH